MERVEQIKQLYKTILNREFDQDGLDYWVATPLSLKEITEYFYKSPEYLSMTKAG